MRAGLAASASGLGLAALADWADTQATIARPTKSDQDRLDAALCLAIACHWRQAPASQSLLLGDVETGYIVTPASPDTAAILRDASQISQLRAASVADRQDRTGIV